MKIIQPLSQFNISVYLNHSARDLLWAGHLPAKRQICDSVASPISPACVEPKGIFCFILSKSLTLWFHSASSHFPPTLIFFPLPFLAFFPSSNLSQSVCKSQYLCPSTSRFGINPRTVAWSPNFSLPPPHHFSVYKIKLLHGELGEDSRSGSERREGQKKRKHRRMKQQRDTRTRFQLQYVHGKLSAAIYLMMHHPGFFTQPCLCSSHFLSVFQPLLCVLWPCFFFLPPSSSPSLFIHFFPLYAYFLWSPTFFTHLSVVLSLPSDHPQKLCSQTP